MSAEINELTEAVIGQAIAIHRELGPGLFENVYETVLAGQLALAGFNVVRQRAVPVTFDGQVFETAFKIDILVEETLILEIKAVEKLGKAHEAQLLTYLRLTNQPVGLLMNFSEATMLAGIRRMINNHAK